MSMFFIVLAFSFASLNFVTCPPQIDEMLKKTEVLPDEYKGMEFNGICKDKQTNTIDAAKVQEVKDICAKFRTQNGYNEAQIKENSGCERVKVALTVGTGLEKRTKNALDTLGLCHLKDNFQDSFCISWAYQQKELFVWLFEPNRKRKRQGVVLFGEDISKKKDSKVRLFGADISEEKDSTEASEVEFVGHCRPLGAVTDVYMQSPQHNRNPLWAGALSFPSQTNQPSGSTSNPNQETIQFL